MKSMTETPQPEALWLAEMLDAFPSGWPEFNQASAELRRLHFEVEQVRERNDFMLGATREAQALCAMYIERMQKAEAEVERQTRHLVEADREWHGKLTASDAEVARLTEELSRLRDHLGEGSRHE
jgi:hypothetical protein